MSSDETLTSDLAKFRATFGYWAPVPGHPREEWRSEITNGDTLQSYHEWVLSRLHEPEGDHRAILEPKYNHAFTLTFSLDSMHKDAHDIVPITVVRAIHKRVRNLHETNELMEAIGPPEDTIVNWVDIEKAEQWHS